MSYSKKKYDVFISFRGEDTRKSFISHLHSELCKANIKAYVDENLKKGDELWPALSQAILNSDMAIVIFSKTYASSKWCLNELVKILQCRSSESHRQVVLPVFYRVDPSHVRNQSGCYREALSKFERNYQKLYIQKKMPQWKKALREAGNISGWDSSNFK
ncbi:PREDICTED: TMV resistance protein N-like [Lupinus angustifolius]|uniref:TMV resistance protein N-like n=1 Tax=Lupinus angustifolius TaxID=3871 RepID=UPI00092E874C|nr:PREDICTED: TMV resistance protein N-like [Lupinus angustifolius]